MATKLHHISALLGMSDMKDLLDLVKNHDKYAAKLKELESVYEKAKEKIELVGAAEDVVSLRTQLEGQKLAVGAEMASLKKDRNTFERAKKSSVNELNIKLKLMESDKKTEWDAKRAELSSMEKSLVSKMKKVEELATNLTVKETKLKNLATSVEKKKAEYENKLARLKDAASGL